MASSLDIDIGELDPTRDKPAIYAWLRSFLRWHLEVWSRAAGLHWTQADIDDHIDAHDLVEREWNDLVGAAQAEARLVAVARVMGRAVGIVCAEEREDRYLRMRMGVLSWLFVEPVSRGQGVSDRLIGASRQWMDERGLRAAEVFVTADNVAAVKVYQRGGYRIIDHRLIARLDRRDDD